ncbi:hypothetical protein L3Q67_26460 [Saccharothrix sp. AJ9571]|nr:hypothetical protein L3Q67_26460 [Saccharothrix sp. AJ9571]
MESCVAGANPEPALDDFDRHLLSAMLGCDCCVDTSTIDELVPDQCPRDEDDCYTDHNDDEACSRNRLGVIERLVAAKIQAAVAAAVLNARTGS